MNTRKKQSPRYSANTKFAAWMRASTPQEHQNLADKTGIPLPWLQRLARGGVRAPSHLRVHKIVTYIQAYNIMQPMDRLPDVDYSDFLEDA